MDIEIHGSVAAQFEPVKKAFRRLWQDIEVGAALCIYYEGIKIVDLWGGFKDRQRTKPWSPDTLVNVYSASKGMATLAFAILVDQGQVRYEDRVADHWPEFGAEGKHQITIAQLLSHQAGLCGIEASVSVEDLYRPDYMANLLAGQKPLWPPAEAAGYHAITWGYFPLELIRRITGQSIGDYLQTRVAQPLAADIYIGLPSNLHHRCADLIGPNHARSASSPGPSPLPAPAEPPNKLFTLALLNPLIAPYKHASSRAWRLAEIPAANGHASARGLAKMYAALAAGGRLNETRIVSRATLLEACQPEVEHWLDLVMGTRVRRSRGFILNTDNAYGPNANAFGHAGAGGSVGYADPDANIAFAYVMNQMQPEDADAPVSRASRLTEVLFACL